MVNCRPFALQVLFLAIFKDFEFTVHCKYVGGTVNTVHLPLQMKQTLNIAHLKQNYIGYTNRLCGYPVVSWNGC